MAVSRDADPAMEEALLGTIPGLEPELVDDGNNPPQDDLDGGGDEQIVDDTGVADPPVDPKQQQQPDPNDPNNQQQVRYDKQGNVIDAKGNIIAPAGRYRRLDEQNRRYKAVVDDQVKKIASLEGRLNEINFLNGAPAKFGLTNEEVAISLDMYHLFKNNPEQAVTMMLSEVAARGVDLNKVLGQQGAISTQAIARMLDQRLAPFDEQAKQQRAAQEVTREATARYNSFLASYPDAVPHQDAIAKLMTDGRASNEEVAYFMLREFAVRNGLDFDQALGPQIQALMNGQPQQQQRQQRQQQPMPNGRPVARQVASREVAVATPDRSYSSIVDEALKEAGIS